MIHHHQKRCAWVNLDNPVYIDYHDNEWGAPSFDDAHLFEMLILEGAQAGLNWEIILKKREGYRQAFQKFDYKKIAQLSDHALEKCMLNPAIVRNRRKIWSCRDNARVFINLQKEYGAFHTFLWAYVDGKPIQNNWARLEDIPTQNTISLTLSKDLKKRGMNFVGPTIMYAYMQAVGMVNDHTTDCWLYNKATM